MKRLAKLFMQILRWKQCDSMMWNKKDGIGFYCRRNDGHFGPHMSYNGQHKWRERA